jgi:dihydroorotate dehydrogenase
MSLFSYETFKNLMFRLQPETAHTIAGLGLRTIGAFPPLQRLLAKKLYIDHPALRQHIFGHTFVNPVGLAAGFDKDADFIGAMPALGFGFTEVGTVTPRPQSGNPKPRLFRLIDDRSIQNAMGFNNKGSYHMIKRLKNMRFFYYPIGINIGKNKITPENEALSDYETLFKAFKDYGTYIVINISSPNTPGLRDLQNESFIKEVFRIGIDITDKPILLKIAPDMEPQQAVALCESAVDAGAAGIIATNTTIDYSLTSEAKDFGGISGELLREKSYDLFRAIADNLYDKTILISAGGISTAEEAYKRIRAGASLVQVYTGFIYQGPSMAKEINEGLIKLVKADGFENISEAIGADIKN